MLERINNIISKFNIKVMINSFINIKGSFSNGVRASILINNTTMTITCKITKIAHIMKNITNTMTKITNTMRKISNMMRMIVFFLILVNNTHLTHLRLLNNKI